MARERHLFELVFYKVRTIIKTCTYRDNMKTVTPTQLRANIYYWLEKF
jgi:hypothetical protein